MNTIVQRAKRRNTGLRLCLSALFFGALPFGQVLLAQSGVSVMEETVHIPGPIKGLKLGLHHAVLGNSATSSTHRVVLIIHGTAVPVSGNPAYHFGGQSGQSMMTALAQQGLDVWALDLYGFGESDRYPEMNEPADKHPPLGTSAECADQVESVVAFLKSAHGVERVMLIGDSGGSLIAGIFATRHPDATARLILFGPITAFSPGPPIGAVLPAYDVATPAELWASFTNWARAAGNPGVLDSTEYRAWAAEYLRSDPTSGSRTPASVKIPNGRAADRVAIASGHFPYDPGQIRAPTLIVMGEQDPVATLPGAEWLLMGLRQAPERRLSVIGHASHTIQYEKERTQLYHVMADFLNER